ncbi:MAG: hypothetical protein ACKO7G_10825 [Gammaproteobacteria bacterium]
MDGRLPLHYDAQRLDWLKVIAAERGILEPRRVLYGGLYEVGHDWLFELAYALAVEMYDGSGLKGRPPPSLKEDLNLVFAVQEMRSKHPNESQRDIAARVHGIDPELIDKKNVEDAKKVDKLRKRYLAAEKRLKTIFGKI